MRIQENYWVIAQRVNHLQGCWFLNMHQMGRCMSTSIVRVKLVISNSWLLQHVSVAEIWAFFIIADREGCQLSWTRRMKIGIGIAQGLRYLHTQLDPPFTISELNSSAVYLTEDFSPKVSQSLEYCSVFNILLLFMHLKRMSWSCWDWEDWFFFTSFSLIFLYFIFEL